MVIHYSFSYQIVQNKCLDLQSFGVLLKCKLHPHKVCIVHIVYSLQDKGKLVDLKFCENYYFYLFILMLS